MFTAQNREDPSSVRGPASQETAGTPWPPPFSADTLPGADKQEFSIANLSLLVEDEGAGISRVVIELHDAQNANIGKVILSKMPEQDVSDFVSCLSGVQGEGGDIGQSEIKSPQVPAETLREALSRVRNDVLIGSSFGTSVENIAAEYGRLLQSEETLTRARVRTICGNGIGDSNDELTWVDIENPNRETAVEVSRKLGVSLGTVMHCLEKQTLSQAFTRNAHLYLCFPEFSIPADDRYAIDFSSVHVLIGNNRLITIHSKPSTAVTWVEEELRGKSLDESDRRYSSHLAGRMIGSAVAGYKQFLIEYSKRVEDLVDDFTKGEVSHKSFVAATKIQRSLGAVESHLTHLVSTISALDDPKHSYGAPETMEALKRFAAQALTLKESAGLLKAEVKNARDNLDAENETRRTESSFSMSVLGNLLAPPAVYAGIVQTAAAVGSVMPANWFYLGLAGSVILSGILTGSFIHRARSRNGEPE